MELTELNKLESLANSIKVNGLLNAIVVYKENDVFKIVAGERRYLSCLLLGYESLPVKILNKKPDIFKIRLTQWAENSDREDLSTWDKLKNVNQIITAYLEQFPNESEEISVRKLSELINVQKSQAARYLLLLKQPQDSLLLQSIKEQKISSLKTAEFLCSIENTATQNRFINMANNGVAIGILKNEYDRDLASASNQMKKGNKKNTYLTIPNNPTIVRFIIEETIKHPLLSVYKDAYSSVNWTSINSVKTIWDKFIEQISEVHSTHEHD